MADVNVRLEIVNLRQFQQAMEQKVRDLGGNELVGAIRAALLLVHRPVRQKTPVDTGRLRASWWPEVTTWREETVGIEGTMVAYGPFVEEDTKPHWPPKGALKVWARRHHIGEAAPVRIARVIRSGPNRGKARVFTTHGRTMTEDQADFLVRRAIARRGTKGKHMLRDAYAMNRERIVKALQDVISQIWRR